MSRRCIRQPIGDQHLATPAMREELPPDWHRIDTPEMREAMASMHAALDRAERALALKAFRRSSVLRLQAARLYRLGAEVLGELSAEGRERWIRGLCAYAAAPGIGEWTTPGRWLWRNRADHAPLDVPQVIVRVR